MARNSSGDRTDKPDQSRKVTRREVLRYTGALALASVASPILAACGATPASPTAGSDGGSSTSPTATASGSSMTQGGGTAATQGAAKSGGMLPVTGNVSITVTDAPGPGSTKADKEFYDMLLSRFKEAHPNIEVKGHAGGYDPQAFAAKVAGGKLEDGFAVWFTEPQKFIQQGIAADITTQMQLWEHFDSFKPDALQVLKDEQGHLYGIPVNEYALSLVYNRKIFQDAGLDPDKPPTTWNQLREYAKQITDKTKKPGFSFLSTENQGGWYFTTLMYTEGVSPMKQEGKKWVATFNEGGKGLEILQMLKEMRWQDNSMTPQQLLNQAKQEQLIATGRVAMAIGGVPGNLKEKYKADINDFGLGIVPQGDGNAVLGGGYAWMFNKKSSPDAIRAAIDWVLFTNFDPQIYEAGLKAAQARGDAIGFPSPPLFTGEMQQQRDRLIAKYANVPTQLYEPYNEGMKKVAVRPEPPFETQKLYAALDPVVQAVLTDRNADPQKLLDSAEKQFQTTVLDRA
jgi:ABC-type glycerol-3-phosphate transport system substrate-binding protein